MCVTLARHGDRAPPAAAATVAAAKTALGRLVTASSLSSAGDSGCYRIVACWTISCIACGERVHDYWLWLWPCCAKSGTTLQ
eukprot:scaffold30581_cov105-Phaeocystis_antarctica.AAC.3